MRMNVGPILLANALVLGGCDNPEPKTSPPAEVSEPGIPLAGPYALEDVQGHACVIKLGEETFPDEPGLHEIWLSAGCEANFPFLHVYRTWMQTGNDITLHGRRNGERSQIL